MNKFFIFLLGAFFCAATVKSQVPARDFYTISGQVIDSLANDPVPYATVSVAFVQAPTQYVNAAACDGNGKFEIQLRAPGNYVMTIQSVGISTLMKPFSLTETNKKIDFGKLFVKESVQAITEVTVAAQRPLVKVEIDKLIYSMEDDPEAKVSNTLEMLRKVPLLSVDGEDKIQLRGSSNFVIYMNGKPSNLLSGQNVSDVLKSMPANTIKNIEVITDPGAKYDAEGIGGIINIITSRNLFQGYQGSVSANAGTFGGYGGSAYLTAKIGKFGLTGNFSHSNMRRPWSENESVSENLMYDLYYMEKNNANNKYSGAFNFGRLEASYEFDTLRLLSLGVNLMDGRQKSISETMTEMFNNVDVFQYGYDRDGDGKYHFGSTGANLDYQRSTRKKDELITISYRFSNSPNVNETYQYVKNETGVLPPEIRLDQWYDNDARTTEHTGQIDYTNPITKAHSIETGIKYILRQNISKVGHYEKDINGDWSSVRNDYSTDFEHISNIYAAYAGYAFKGEKIGFRTGLRAEGTDQNVKYRLDESKNFGVDYFNLVPNVTVSYQLKPTQQMRVGYNLRISRPGIWYLNPYVNDTDPKNISYGNPELDPEKSHNFNFNYSYFSPKITLNASASYLYVNNGIESYQFIEQTKPDVKQRTYKNIGRNHRASMYVSAGWTPNRTLRFNLNGGLNYVDLKSPELDVSNSGLTGNCNLMAQVTLPKDFRISVNGYYMSGWIMLQGKQSDYCFTSITANKDFLKKKLTVSLSCFNPVSKSLKMKMSTSTDYFVTNSTYTNPWREGRISVFYRFGTMKEAIKKVQRGINNDDVKAGGDGGNTGGGDGAGGGGM